MRILTTQEIEIGKRIEKIRKEMCLPKTRFAQLIGISAQALGAIEKGENGIACTTLISLCEKTGVSSEYILFGRTVPPPGNRMLTALLVEMKSSIQTTEQTLKKIDSCLVNVSSL